MRITNLLAASLSLVPAGIAAADDFIEDLTRRYADIDTLHATIVQQQNTSGARHRPASMTTQSWTYTIAFDRDAGRLTLTAPWGDHAHTPDGYLITCHDDCNIYAEHPDSPLSIAALARGEHNNTSYTLQLPVLDLLIGDRAHDYAHTKGTESRGTTRKETIDGEPCTVHEATRPYSNEPEYQLDEGPEITCPAEYWISDATGLIERVVIDSTDASRIWYEQSGYGDPSYFDNIDSFIVSFDIDYHAVDKPLDPAVFEISTEGLEYSDEPHGGGGDEAFSDPDGARFIHQPAPSFTATTLTGDAISTEDLKGKVVLIDFWATWCPPCVASMPALQKIAEQYADRGVVVLGINKDRPADRDAVDEFLADNNITFPQILDNDNTLATRFGVNAYPTTVLIDREGVVQAYAVGAHDKADYTASIDKILAGESLPMPTPAPNPADTVDTIENIALNFFTWPAPVSAWYGKKVTTPDGDALVMPHDAGGLAKLDHATGTLSRIAMQGYDTNRTTLAFAPVDDEHGGWIFATDDSYDYGDIAFTRIDRNGTRRWSVPLGIDPAIEPMYEAGIEVCDIDSDGKDEFLIVAAVTDSQDYEQSVFLVVLENNGRALYTKKLSLDGYSTTHLVENEGEPPAFYIFGYSQFIRVTLDF